MSRSEPIRPSTSSGLCILYMEDDPGLARLVQKRLERAGYVVDIAHDGEEGLAMFAAGSYEVVAVDQNMPVHDGLEVIRILASQGPLPPTIMVTGTGNEKIAVEAMKLGAQDYIVKDVEGGYLDLLPTVIEQVLQQQRLVEEKRRAEEALQESEKWHRLLLSSITDGCWVLDAEWRYTLVNEAGAQLVDMSPDQLLGHKLTALFPGIEKTEFFAAYERSMRERTTENVTASFTFPDGRERTYEVQMYPAPDGILCIGRDITERVQAEEQRERLVLELQDALAQVKTLSGLIPICASCRKVRDDEGFWNQLETYIQEHSEAEFSHGICPECVNKLYPELFGEDE